MKSFTEALKEVSAILNRENTTWQEKKNILAELVIKSHKENEIADL